MDKFLCSCLPMFLPVFLFHFCHHSGTNWYISTFLFSHFIRLFISCQMFIQLNKILRCFFSSVVFDTLEEKNLVLSQLSFPSISSQVHVQMNNNGEGTLLKRRPSKNGSATVPLSSGDGAVVKKQGTSFLAYCTHEPVILMHHLFIGGFGFLVIVVRTKCTFL